MMPAWLRFAAATRGARVSILSMNLSSLAALPPPRMKRSGRTETQASQVFVETFAPAAPGKILALAHRIGAIVFGHHAFQHQVTQFGIGQQLAIDEDGGTDAGADGDENDDPWRSCPVPKRISARPAASASFRTWQGRPVTSANRWAASVSIQLLSMLEAFLAMPLWMVAGKPHPTGPFHWKCSTSALRVCATAAGVAGCGVAMRWRSPISSPVSVSTRQPLIPDPQYLLPASASESSFYCADVQWSAEHEKWLRSGKGQITYA